MQNTIDNTVKKLEKLGGESILLPVDVAAGELNTWLQSNTESIKTLLNSYGAVVIRKLPIQGSKKLERVLTTLFDDKLLEYNYRSTPRTKMRGRIYTSSEYHPEETIGLHNENAYSNEWAMQIAFYCVKPAEVGGATPIADSRKVYQAIPAEIREEFERKKLLYVRNYGDIDLPWQEVFQTNDRKEVEEFCSNNAINFEWRGDNDLRTSQLAGAAYNHPKTMEKVWFNQAHLFHVSSLGEDNEKSLLDTFEKDNLPRNVYFGNGDEIDADMLNIIRKAYEQNMITFDWHEGDLMLLDNMLFSHGRQPYSGSRRVLVGMAGVMNASLLTN
ncbi:TauD/TfdA family dioxygenase [Aliikangiella marina]|uniref:TauD/TfdA family dioxygenase n=2 Tax=Aliikangiella marina TaxID=1712262 RepID=A0A545TK38_9GAMM|nr:TauD/TfdA family dioxygenase [Aliikangiella marina]